MPTVIALLFSLSILGASAQYTPDKIRKVYAIGVQALKDKDFDKAETYLTAVVKANPAHGNAQYYLLQIEQLKSSTSRVSSKRQLKNIMLQLVEFDDVPLNEALLGFSILIDQSNGQSPPPNVALKDPKFKIRTKPITLTLKKVGAEQAFGQILNVAGAKAKYTENIIEVLPL